jgi:hypothetical protein
VHGRCCLQTARDRSIRLRVQGCARMGGAKAFVACAGLHMRRAVGMTALAVIVWPVEKGHKQDKTSLHDITEVVHHS